MAKRYNRPGRLLPFRQVSEQDTINQYALDGTGVMGIFVSVKTDQANFDDNDSWMYGTSPGKNYDDYGIYSYRYGTNIRVTPCQSGDTSDVFLGVTLFNVAEYDENDEKLLYYKQKTKETSTIVSGKTVPVGTRGLYLITNEAYVNATGNSLGLPQVGELVVPSNSEDGKVDIVSRVELTGSYGGEQQVIGKVIGTGSKHGGYAAILLNW